jgi:hypothetical protein
MCSAKATYMYINGRKYHTCPIEGCDNAQSGSDNRLCDNCFRKKCMNCNTIKHYKIRKDRIYGKACQECIPKLKMEYEKNCAVCNSCYDKDIKFRCSKHTKHSLATCLNCKSKYFTYWKTAFKSFCNLKKINGVYPTENNCCDACCPGLESENKRIYEARMQKAAVDKLELERLQKQFYDSYHLEVTYKCELSDFATINDSCCPSEITYLTKSFTVVEYRPLPKSIRQCDIEQPTGLVKKLDRLPKDYNKPTYEFMDFDHPSYFELLYAYVKKIEHIELS